MMHDPISPPLRRGRRSRLGGVIGSPVVARPPAWILRWGRTRTGAEQENAQGDQPQAAPRSRSPSRRDSSRQGLTRRNPRCDVRERGGTDGQRNPDRGVR